jgi:hypothetical protein
MATRGPEPGLFSGQPGQQKTASSMLEGSSYKKSIRYSQERYVIKKSANCNKALIFEII